MTPGMVQEVVFPSFWEGLSLRPGRDGCVGVLADVFLRFSMGTFKKTD